ncbi:MAG: single-stranded-DNA-specific exonuclease RecJ [Planctomycetota bacterium]|jgi:single-stranded-DNA-specific exonuclease|nr:single-stranded-DNA-specific exonuclease RecJ [Planctomycetota bacterium]
MALSFLCRLSGRIVGRFTDLSKQGRLCLLRFSEKNDIVHAIAYIFFVESETPVASAQWLVRPHPGPITRDLSGKFKISEILAAIIAQRVSPLSDENVASFIKPSLNSLASPWLMDGMDGAVDRLVLAVQQRQKTVVYGDYDTDGVTACALMIRACRAIGYHLDYRLPSRFEEGYGISPDFVKKAIAEKVDLVVTVDCGTSEHENIRILAENGVDVIITDHHEPGDRELPPAACAVLNPKRTDSSYPFRELTGVGVAFKLAWALYERLAGSPKVGEQRRDALLSLLPLVAIGTIADVAPLIGENRSAVSWGLKMMHTASPGISALLDVCRLGAGDLTSRSIAFSLSPRLNAAGRMGAADLSLELLIEDDPRVARELAECLDRQNVERQALCQTILEEAARTAEDTHDLERDAAILVAKDGWHEGVIGIVAGRLTEIYNKPAAVVSFPDGQAKGRGSARAVHGLNLYQAMANSRRHLLSFGGHELAAGFTVRRDELSGLRESFLRECGLQIEQKRISPTLMIDMELRLSDVNNSLVAELEILRPFGQGNPEPRFIARGARAVGSPQLMGVQKQHFNFNVAQDGVAYRAVVFNNLELLELLDSAGRQPLDIAFSPSLNAFYSPPRLELRIEDIRVARDA